MSPAAAPDRARALLDLRDVAVAPPGREAPLLVRVTVAVAAGECVALVGPSGSGKTTLLRTIAGMIPARSGNILLDGADVATLAGRARARIGIVGQRHDLVERLRVDRNVMAGALGRWSTARALRYLLWARADELAEAEAALASVGLAHKLREPTAALSGGEQQRVAIARALVQAPALLLADEPVASLDPETAAAVLALLTRLARERGMALVTSLHQPDLAARFCDRVLAVREGTVTARDPAPRVA